MEENKDSRDEGNRDGSSRRWGGRRVFSFQHSATVPCDANNPPLS